MGHRAISCFLGRRQALACRRQARPIKIRPVSSSDLYYHTEIFMRRIRWKESNYHVKLVQCYYRQLSSTRKNKIADVYAQVIVDVEKISLNRTQLDYLSCSGK